MFKKKTGKVLVGLVAALTLTFAAFVATGCSNDKAETTDTTNENATNTQVSTEIPDTSTEPTVITTVEADDPYGKGIHHVVMNVEGYEPITIELNADAAPVSVSNFMHLVEDGYYDGLSFYRFQDGFCMQGGTKGNTASGSDPELTEIVGEFADNNVNNPLANDFKRGTVAMARTMEPNSATSTFFVTLASGDAVSVSLNGQYAAFGNIDENGMKVIDKIVADRANAQKDQMGMVIQDSDQAPITSITIVD